MSLVSLQGVNVGFGGLSCLRGRSPDRAGRAGLPGGPQRDRQVHDHAVITGRYGPTAAWWCSSRDWRTTLLTQEVPGDIRGSVFDVVSGRIRRARQAPRRLPSYQREA